MVKQLMPSRLIPKYYTTVLGGEPAMQLPVSLATILTATKLGLENNADYVPQFFLIKKDCFNIVHFRQTHLPHKLLGLAR